MVIKQEYLARAANQHSHIYGAMHRETLPVHDGVSRPKSGLRIGSKRPENGKRKLERTNYYSVIWNSHAHSDYGTHQEVVEFLAKKLPSILKYVRIKFGGKLVSQSERRRLIINALESLN
jgi:hypothetical protein